MERIVLFGTMGSHYLKRRQEIPILYFWNFEIDAGERRNHKVLCRAFHLPVQIQTEPLRQEKIACVPRNLALDFPHYVHAITPSSEARRMEYSSRTCTARMMTA